MDIDIEQMVFTAAIFRNTNVGEVARAIGMAPSSLYKKISRNTLKAGELAKIAKVLGGEYVFYSWRGFNTPPFRAFFMVLKPSPTTFKNQHTSSLQGEVVDFLGF